MAARRLASQILPEYLSETCRELQETIDDIVALRPDEPGTWEFPPQVATHLDQCPACSDYVQELAHDEPAAYRDVDEEIRKTVLDHVRGPWLTIPVGPLISSATMDAIMRSSALFAPRAMLTSTGARTPRQPDWTVTSHGIGAGRELRVEGYALAGGRFRVVAALWDTRANQRARGTWEIGARLDDEPLVVEPRRGGIWQIKRRLTLADLRELQITVRGAGTAAGQSPS